MRRRAPSGFEKLPADAPRLVADAPCRARGALRGVPPEHMRLRAMIQIIASNPISASSFRRGLARRARANGASPRASPDVVPRRATITYADDELTRASPPPISRYHRRRRIRGGDPQSRRSRTPRARPRRRPRGRAPRLSRARASPPRGGPPSRSPPTFAPFVAAPASASSTRPPRTTPLPPPPSTPPSTTSSTPRTRKPTRVATTTPTRPSTRLSTRPSTTTKPRRVLRVGFEARRRPPRARRRRDGPLLGARPRDARRRPRRGWRGREGRAGGAGFLLVQP